jgi:hypothetical protein
LKKWGNIARHQWLMSVFLATQEAEIRRIVVRSQPWANSSRDSISKKITRPKRTGDMAQVVECLLCKHDTLSSNPNPTKKGGGTGIKILDH